MNQPLSRNGLGMGLALVVGFVAIAIAISNCTVQTEAGGVQQRIAIARIAAAEKQAEREALISLGRAQAQTAAVH